MKNFVISLSSCEQWQNCRVEWQMLRVVQDWKAPVHFFSIFLRNAFMSSEKQRWHLHQLNFPSSHATIHFSDEYSAFFTWNQLGVLKKRALTLADERQDGSGREKEVNAEQIQNKLNCKTDDKTWRLVHCARALSQKNDVLLCFATYPTTTTEEKEFRVKMLLSLRRSRHVIRRHSRKRLFAQSDKIQVTAVCERVEHLFFLALFKSIGSFNMNGFRMISKQTHTPLAIPGEPSKVWNYSVQPVISARVEDEKMWE